MARLVPLFTPFDNFKEDAVLHQDTTLVPKKDVRGYNFKRWDARGEDFVIVGDETIIKQIKYLGAVEEMYDIYVDSISFEEEFIMTTKRDQLGFETYLDLQDVERGRHNLIIVGPVIGKKEKGTLITIPFWYYP